MNSSVEEKVNFLNENCNLEEDPIGGPVDSSVTSDFQLPADSYTTHKVSIDKIMYSFFKFCRLESN